MPVKMEDNQRTQRTRGTELEKGTSDTRKAKKMIREKKMHKINAFSARIHTPTKIVRIKKLHELYRDVFVCCTQPKHVEIDRQSMHVRTLNSGERH